MWPRPCVRGMPATDSNRCKVVIRCILLQKAGDTRGHRGHVDFLGFFWLGRVGTQWGHLGTDCQHHVTAVGCHVIGRSLGMVVVPACPRPARRPMTPWCAGPTRLWSTEWQAVHRLSYSCWPRTTSPAVNTAEAAAISATSARSCRACSRGLPVMWRGHHGSALWTWLWDAGSGGEGLGRGLLQV